MKLNADKIMAKSLMDIYLDNERVTKNGSSVSLKVFINSKVIYVDDFETIDTKDTIIRLIYLYDLAAKETIELLSELKKVSTIYKAFYEHTFCSDHFEEDISALLGFYILCNDGCGNHLCIDSKSYEFFELNHEMNFEFSRENYTSFLAFKKELKKRCKNTLII